jgi:hypothetical protein
MKEKKRRKKKEGDHLAWRYTRGRCARVCLDGKSEEDT